MSFRRWLLAAKTRRSLAAALVILSIGGLVLSRTRATPVAPTEGATATLPGASKANSAQFAQSGLEGTLSLSQRRVLAGAAEEQRVFAELVLKANAAPINAGRAPLAMAVVFDTSGSMQGDKLRTSKDSVLKLLRQMRAEDQITFVRYQSSHDVMQPLASISEVRSDLIARIQALEADGGTNIPPALQAGIDALSQSPSGRVKRVVLVSDGLDSTRTQAESLARGAANASVVVSALGIGLDFDEAYMASVAQAGRGNFGFVRDGSALAQFLQRELHQTASTIIEGAVVRLKLPEGLALVEAFGVSTEGSSGRQLSVNVGTLYAGEERRMILELSADLEHDHTASITSEMGWNTVGGGRSKTKLEPVSLTGERDAGKVAASRDPRVFASSVSVTASARQLEASQAFARGDKATADSLIAGSMAELEEAAKVAPTSVARRMYRQSATYQEDRASIARSKPLSAAGKNIAKRTYQKNLDNLKAASF